MKLNNITNTIVVIFSLMFSGNSIAAIVDYTCWITDIKIVKEDSGTEIYLSLIDFFTKKPIDREPLKIELTNYFDIVDYDPESDITKVPNSSELEAHVESLKLINALLLDYITGTKALFYNKKTGSSLGLPSTVKVDKRKKTITEITLQS